MTEDLDLSSFRRSVKAELASRLQPRPDDALPHLYGIRDDDDQRRAGKHFLLALADLGWSTPHWPTEFGGAGFTPAQATALGQELAGFDVPDLYPYDVGLRMVASVLFKHATAQQQQRWLENIRRGEEVWCQLFSEPEAGSDLAGLRCRAERTDEGWVISGRKTWSSRAAYAQWGLLLARSDPAADRHHGITAFAVPMTTDGVSISPIKQMNGDDHFAEVLFESALLPDSLRLGDVDGGWSVAMTTLANERAGLRTAGIGLRARDVLPLLTGRPLPAPLRDELLQAYIDLEVARLTNARVAAAVARGQTPGPEGSGSKLRTAAAMRRLSDLALRALGTAGLVDNSFWSALALTSPSMSIRGGTDQIQKTIIGERVLGLPREAR